MESLRVFAERRFCGHACSAGHQYGHPKPEPKPAEVVAFPVDPQAFTRVYQHYLARGRDILEELEQDSW